MRLRARSAVALAVLLAAPLVLAAVPRAADRALQAHSASSALGGQLALLLAQLEAMSPPPVPAGVLGAAPSPAPPPGRGQTGPLMQLHVMAGARTWTSWISSTPHLVDLDGDGTAELRASLVPGQPPQLALEGLAPAHDPWVAWLESGPARWGLAGNGLAPRVAVAGFREGELHVRAEGSAQGWQAAFALAATQQRAVAWLAEKGLPTLDATAGLGFDVRLPSAVPGGLRVVLLEGAAAHDVTLRDTPAGAILARTEEGALRYRAPHDGGAISYVGSAAPLGQKGSLQFGASPLTGNLSLEPRGAGFRFASSRPTDLLLDWQPPGSEGLRVVGNGMPALEVQPGSKGGLILDGEGTVAVLRPRAAGDHSSASGDAQAASVATLGTDGALAVGVPSAAIPAVVAAALGSLATWAVLAHRPKKSVA